MTYFYFLLLSQLLTLYYQYEFITNFLNHILYDQYGRHGPVALLFGYVIDVKYAVLNDGGRMYRVFKKKKTFCLFTYFFWSTGFRDLYRSKQPFLGVVYFTFGFECRVNIQYGRFDRV